MGKRGRGAKGNCLKMEKGHQKGHRRGTHLLMERDPSSHGDGFKSPLGGQRPKTKVIGVLSCYYAQLNLLYRGLWLNSTGRLGQPMEGFNLYQSNFLLRPPCL